MWMMEFLQRLKKSLRRGRTTELPCGKDEAFFTLLPMVLANQHKAVSDLLSGSNFDVNFARGRTQRTLLHIAANCGAYECLCLLVKRGANVNALDAAHCTPLHLTARNGHRKSLNKLLEAKADVHIHNKEGLTALHWLAVNGRIEMLQDLLGHVTDVDIVDVQGQTALHVACQNGHNSTLQCLMNHGASVNKKNHNGWTPLHFACSHGQHGVVEELLKRNAEVFFNEVGPNSLIEICMERGYGDTCEVLLNHHPKLFKHLMQLMQHCHVIKKESLLKVFSHLCGTEPGMRLRLVEGLAEQASVIGHKLLSGSQNLEQESECLLRCFSVLEELQFQPRARAGSIGREAGGSSDPENSGRVLVPLPLSSLQHLSTLWQLLDNWLCLIGQELRDQGSPSRCLMPPKQQQGTSEDPPSDSSGTASNSTGQNATEGSHARIPGSGKDSAEKSDGTALVGCSRGGPDQSPGATPETPRGETDAEQQQASSAAGERQSQKESAAVGSDSKSSVKSKASRGKDTQELTENVVLGAVERVCAVLQAMFLCSKLNTGKEPPVQFLDFVKKHLHVLQRLVQRDPGLIFQHFHFLLDMPSLITSFLPIIKSQPFETRREWFYANLPPIQADEVTYERREALHIHRDRLFHSSCEEVLQRSPSVLMTELNIQFSGEEGVGHGVVREWFDTLSREILNPDYALFTQSADGRTFQPNSNSSINPDHLSYFRFAGQILGLALYHRYLLSIYFTRSFYKHILGVPVNYTDVASIDPEYAKNLQWILDHNIDELGLDLTFSVETDVFSIMQEVDLKKGGSSVPVTDKNKAEYVQLVTELRMTRAIMPQIDSFLSGFHDYIPHSLVRMFDEYELELLLSGLPEIDLVDWQTHTVYHDYSADSPVIKWFWGAVEAMSEQMRVQLLQFVTGSSRVPYGGFSQLSSSGTIQLFTICRTSYQTRALPTASTCINLLKLPEYPSQAELQECLTIALQCGSQGYGLV